MRAPVSSEIARASRRSFTTLRPLRAQGRRASPECASPGAHRGHVGGDSLEFYFDVLAGPVLKEEVLVTAQRVWQRWRAGAARVT